MQRVLNDALISAAALCALLAALMSMDERVREQIVRWVRGTSVSGAGEHIGNVGSIVLQATLEQGVAHAPLMLFVLAAVLLVVFMLRT
jgi:hypothetical protein